MLDDIKTKIRALTEDWLKIETDPFEYILSDSFELTQSNVNEVLSVTVDGTVLQSGEYEFDEDTNEVVIVETSGISAIVVKYNYYKYSTTELTEYVRAALAWVAIYGYTEEQYELKGTTLYPTLTTNQESLIAVIAATLINPEYSEYRLPNVTVRYPRTMSKEERIKVLVNNFLHGKGYCDVIEWDEII